MIKLHNLTDYAVILLTSFDEARDSISSAAQLSDKTGLSLPTVSKILKLLAGANILRAERGKNGGYRLNRPFAQITMAEVIEAIQGPVAVTACADGASDSCALSSRCHMNGRWSIVNTAIRGALENISLRDMLGHEKTHPIKNNKTTTVIQEGISA